jgi:hypothetical protein
MWPLWPVSRQRKKHARIGEGKGKREQREFEAGHWSLRPFGRAVNDKIRDLVEPDIGRSVDHRIGPDKMPDMNRKAENRYVNDCDCGFTELRHFLPFSSLAPSHNGRLTSLIYWPLWLVSIGHNGQIENIFRWPCHGQGTALAFPLMPLDSQEKTELSAQIRLLLELNEPEAMLEALRQIAARKAQDSTIAPDEAKRWQTAANALIEALATVNAAQSPAARQLAEHMAQWAPQAPSQAQHSPTDQPEAIQEPQPEQNT